MTELGKYSFGIGDRFSMQGESQLKALKMALEKGFEVIPVWNKSNREHVTIGSLPGHTRLAADKAVEKMGWNKPYFVDADHINKSNVDKFIDCCDFFTIDVADYIGKMAERSDIETFISKNKEFTGQFSVPGGDQNFEITNATLQTIAGKFLYAIKQAAEIYRYISSKKGPANFVAEISMDEVNDAQSPVELFFILSAVAAEKIPLANIAPKFTGRFNKGVDYIGDLVLFEKEFTQDLLVIDHAIKTFGLPSSLKLSVHSGSDKFSIYPIIGKLLKKYDKGIHVKTAGTTWLEEAIGLSMAGGEALELMKTIYYKALNRFDELTGPYSTVIDIDRKQLPLVAEVSAWNGEQMADALRHIPGNPSYNPHLRQLMHVAYKLAAEEGNGYYSLLRTNQEIVGQQVTINIYERHLKRLFGF